MSRLQKNTQLSDAAIAVLTCAASNDCVVVMDGTYGRDVAAAEGITTRGTAYLILLLVKRDMIHVAEARTAIDAMIDEGWYCAPNVYAAIIRKLDSLGN